MIADQPFLSYRIHLAGHVDLGIVSARRDASGTFEIEPDAAHGRRFIGPASIYTAEEVRPPPPLPEPTVDLIVKVRGARHMVRSANDEFILFADGVWMNRAGWKRPEVETVCSQEMPVPYSDDDIPF